MLIANTVTHTPLHLHPLNKMRIRLTLTQPPLLPPNRMHTSRKLMMHTMPMQHHPRLPQLSRLSVNA